MKRLFLTTFFFTITIVSVYAQQNLEKSILWEIQGNELKSPSYLLGTVHMVCTGDVQVADKVLRAIDEVEQIALEVNLVDVNELMSIQELIVSPAALSSQLTDAEREEFSALLKSKYALDMKVVDHYPPIILMGLLAAKEVSCETTGYDIEILNLGLSKNKYFLGLERFKDQVELTNQCYTAKDILTQVREKEQAAEEFVTLVKAFNQEDIEALYELTIESGFLTEEMRVALLDNRNHAWVEKMRDLMPKAPTLFAVGAGHLAGEHGVIQLLRNQGFTITAVLK
ncbi:MULTISPECIES: TraB/GumN family protein [unclassified Myroides]|uniref:TraB/GumN family protein n=1 Tax=unclassified Myroides TaxID=2642485 RepID=UPI003D2F8CEF